MKARKVQTAIERKVSDSWSLAVPATFHETAVEDEAYWHGADRRRSISTTSLLILDEHGAVPVPSLMAVFGGIAAETPGASPVKELPPGLAGWAMIAPALQPAVADSTLSGMVFVDGQALIVTITSDDLDWARRTWQSIRYHDDETAATWAH
jgi:hypothetical protein